MTERMWHLPPLTQSQYDQLDAVLTFALERYQDGKLHPVTDNYRAHLQSLYDTVKRALAVEPKVT